MLNRAIEDSTCRVRFATLETADIERVLLLGIRICGLDSKHLLDRSSYKQSVEQRTICIFPRRRCPVCQTLECDDSALNLACEVLVNGAGLSEGRWRGSDAQQGCDWCGHGRRIVDTSWLLLGVVVSG